MSSPTPHRFDHPVWDLRDVIGWVLDRDPAQFGRIHSTEDAKSAINVALFYTSHLRPERDPNALTTLLHELQLGRLIVHEGKAALPREHWGALTELDLRSAISRGLWFWSEDVLRLWPVEAAPVKAVASGISNRKGGQNRVPNWTIWKHIPDVKAFEAVALSLNIDPKKLGHNPRSWMAGKRLFEEGEEFQERLFAVDRNLKTIGIRNFAGVRYFDEDPMIRLRAFAVWAVSIGWSLPSELVELGNGASGAPSSAEAAETEEKSSEPAGAKPEPPLRISETSRPGAKGIGRSGRKKGSGSIDDTEALQLMLHLLASGQANSVHDAARKVPDSIMGSSQSQAADISRLRRKFANDHGTEPPTGKTWADVAGELNAN